MIDIEGGSKRIGSSSLLYFLWDIKTDLPIFD